MAHGVRGSPLALQALGSTIFGSHCSSWKAAFNGQRAYCVSRTELGSIFVVGSVQGPLKLVV
ncbi:hypothetical protein SCLCIDRAFT_1224835 [Scleroderma citrinum Foug A]|uniref:Uncharacterized protein n=1 Tax=Scleroderma citrinum Foug A TaxID=1036808 RepID=A0A0C3CRA7_9AGAM|nr:hypothetical protein SCLCIDRAFT_1224835 [Scleroderma citrinum Foug A]